MLSSRHDMEACSQELPHSSCGHLCKISTDEGPPTPYHDGERGSRGSQPSPRSCWQFVLEEGVIFFSGVTTGRLSVL